MLLSKLPHHHLQELWILLTNLFPHLLQELPLRISFRYHLEQNLVRNFLVFRFDAVATMCKSVLIWYSGCDVREVRFIWKGRPLVFYFLLRHVSRGSIASVEIVAQACCCLVRKWKPLFITYTSWWKWIMEVSNPVRCLESSACRSDGHVTSSLVYEEPPSPFVPYDQYTYLPEVTSQILLISDYVINSSVINSTAVPFGSA